MMILLNNGWFLFNQDLFFIFCFKEFSIMTVKILSSPSPIPSPNFGHKTNVSQGLTLSGLVKSISYNLILPLQYSNQPY